MHQLQWTLQQLACDPALMVKLDHICGDLDKIVVILLSILFVQGFSFILKK